MPGRVLFRERQRFRQPWLFAVLAITAGIGWWGFIQQVVLRRPFGNNPAPDAMLLIILALTGVALPALFLLGGLATEVRTDGVSVRFTPFHLHPRTWRWHEIASIEARTYSPIREYGGWGIRAGAAGVAYNVSGSQGVQLVLRSGRRILIGSREPDRFMAAVHAARGTAPA